MKRNYWSGISKDERVKAIDEITGIVDRYATIMNFQKVSDISLSLMLEVRECDLKNLQEGLEKLMVLEGTFPGKNPVNSKRESIVFLNVTFTQGTGDMKTNIPHIPG